MKKSIKVILITLVIFSTQTNAQNNNSKIGVNEVESQYSKNYDIPMNIEFVFSGDLKNPNYFYSDLEKLIKIKFVGTKVEISFKYLNKEPHSNSMNIGNEPKTIFHLDTTNAKVINENNGSDRLIKFSLNGVLINEKDSESIFKFKSVVHTIHDINNQNKKIVDYLFTKLYMN
jgi:hypothetical protein